MPVSHVHTFLVHPNRGVENPPAIGGTNVPLSGKVFDLIKDIYDTSDSECQIDVSFNNRPDGTASNPCRTLICDYIQTPSVVTGRTLADRLSSVTTKRSGLGLMFLALGTEGLKQKIILARFPANNGILAEETSQTLTVEFLERVFMRSATAYKAVAFHDQDLSTGFWIGKIVDRQINSRDVEVSQYWVSDFLDSDFRTTSASGTRRLAVALRDTARKTSDIRIKQEITAAATLAAGLAGQNLTARDFMDRFGFSEEAKTRALTEMGHPSLANERFKFSAEEFKRQLPYRTVELNTGAILTADSEDFSDIFQQENLGPSGETRFSTVGKIVGDKFEKSK